MCIYTLTCTLVCVHLYFLAPFAEKAYSDEPTSSKVRPSAPTVGCEIPSPIKRNQGFLETWLPSGLG